MIHRAFVSDIPAIQAMAEVVFRQTYHDILSPEQMEYMMDMMYSTANLERQMTREGHIWYIAEGRGYVSFRLEGKVADGGEERLLYHLEKIYVMPEMQKSGFGRKLFEFAVRKIHDAAYTAGLPARIELNVNRGNPAVGFYEHMGMTRARSGDFPIGNGFFMNDYIMSLDIEIA